MQATCQGLQAVWDMDQGHIGDQTELSEDGATRTVGTDPMFPPYPKKDIEDLYRQATRGVFWDTGSLHRLARTSLDRHLNTGRLHSRFWRDFLNAHGSIFQGLYSQEVASLIWALVMAELAYDLGNALRAWILLRSNRLSRVTDHPPGVERLLKNLASYMAMWKLYRLKKVQTQSA